ncbi:hypothetical protein RND81_14G083500 [Saponaria officinalis]|uniref:Uncharacterized protein n=1 Tax=Saponaria officinalis TaxID=3572 RepID=A0AAW1GTW6_SAPOF
MLCLSLFFNSWNYYYFFFYYPNFFIPEKLKITTLFVWVGGMSFGSLDTPSLPPQLVHFLFDIIHPPQLVHFLFDIIYELGESNLCTFLFDIIHEFGESLKLCAIYK